MLYDETYYLAISDLVNNHKRAIFKDEALYRKLQSKYFEFHIYCKPHPISGSYQIDHAALPPVGYMNQEYIFTRDLEEFIRNYNKVIIDKQNKPEPNKRPKGKKRG